MRLEPSITAGQRIARCEQLEKNNNKKVQKRDQHGWKAKSTGNCKSAKEERTVKKTQNVKHCQQTVKTREGFQPYTSQSPPLWRAGTCAATSRRPHRNPPEGPQHRTTYGMMDNWLRSTIATSRKININRKDNRSCNEKQAGGEEKQAGGEEKQHPLLKSEEREDGMSWR